MISFDLEKAKRTLSKTQRNQLNGMLRKMGYQPVRWESIKRHYDVTEHQLAEALAEYDYYDDALNCPKKPIEVSGSFEAIKCFDDDKVAVSIYARGDHVAEINVYHYDGAPSNHRYVGDVVSYKDYIDKIEHLWVKR